MAHHPSASKSSGIYLYGRHPITLALRNPRRRIFEMWMMKGALEGIKIPDTILLHWVSREQLEALVGQDATHQGVVARCAPLPSYKLDTLIQDSKTVDTMLVVLLDQVSDPHNIGAILRSATAFQAAAVIVPEAGAPDESGVLAKSASGALELTPLIRVPNLVRAMETLKKADFWCLGMDGHADDILSHHQLPNKCALVMGSEGSGMRRLTAECCDYMTKLPMNTEIESLNVSNACAIALYEWYRQKKIP